MTLLSIISIRFYEMETKHIIPGQKIGYIRVSTEEQNTNRQLDGVELHRIFMDKCSGKDTKRPQLEQLINFVRTGDQIYVHSMDRLARNLDDLRSLVKHRKELRLHLLRKT